MDEQTHSSSEHPWIGEIVDFQDGVFGRCAAIITNVYHDHTVLLAIFQKMIPINDEPPVVYHRASRSEDAKIGHWSWRKRKL